MGIIPPKINVSLKEDHDMRNGGNERKLKLSMSSGKKRKLVPQIIELIKQILPLIVWSHVSQNFWMKRGRKRGKRDGGERERGRWGKWVGKKRSHDRDIYLSSRSKKSERRERIITVSSTPFYVPTGPSSQEKNFMWRIERKKIEKGGRERMGREKRWRREDRNERCVSSPVFSIKVGWKKLHWMKDGRGFHSHRRDLS